MLYKRFIYSFSLLLLWAASVLPGQAQEILPVAEGEAGTFRPDSVRVSAAPFVPRVSYGLNAGASFSNFGSVSYVEPRVQYRVTPRFHVFSSLTMLQSWGGPTFRRADAEGSSTVMTAAPDRQYLLHVGGTYAMSERLLLSGSVWKDLSSSPTNRWNSNPFLYGRFPNQGFQFQAQYQVAPNVTISGGVRYGNGGNYGYGGYPGSGFNSMWGY